MYPDLALDTLETPGVPERDAALAHAIYDAAVRRWITLQQLLLHHLRQPWDSLEPAVVAALLGGAAQLLLFDRIPPHAAIDETVEWTKSAARSQAAGLVNAVLRKVASMVERSPAGDPVRRDAWSNARDELPLPDGRALRLRHTALPPEPLVRAAAATGVPRRQLREWAEHFGENDALRIAWHSTASAPTIVYVGGSSAPPQSGLLLPHASPQHRVFTGSRAELLTLLREHGEVWVQDPTASSALDLVGAEPADTVVDLCAGRGTKTRQLLARFPGARLYACEVTEPRLQDLAALSRSSAGRPVVRRPAQAASELARSCDLVLADVPCSNSGVLARRVEARHRCSGHQVARLGEQQREIVSLAVGMLGAGGRLLYSTCSLEPAENVALVDWACRSHGLRLDTERLCLPEGGPGRPPSEYRDGGYAALLRKG